MTHRFLYVVRYNGTVGFVEKRAINYHYSKVMNIHLRLSFNFGFKKTTSQTVDYQILQNLLFILSKYSKSSLRGKLKDFVTNSICKRCWILAQTYVPG